MSDYFKTDTDQLGEFLKALKQSVQELDEARSALAHVRAGQIGTHALDQACDDFQEEWRNGSEQIAKMIGEVSGGVEKNKANYEKMEENLTRLMKRIEGGDR